MFNMRNFTFGEWLNEFIEVYKKPFLKSCVMPELIVRLHVPDEIKSVKLDELTLFEVERAINGVKASRTRLMTRNVCHQALKKAYSLHLISTDIAAELAPVPHTYKQGEALTTAEQREFLGKLKGNPLEGLLMFCLLTGARRSEAVGMLKSDVDLAKNTIHIRGTKTKTSNRTIPIVPQLQPFIIRAMDGDGKLLFRCTGDHLTRVFKDLCPNHHLHDLRHTFATRCLESGISMKIVQKWLGHSRLETTAAIYTHVLDPFMFSEATKFRLD